eukprot:1223117-Amphidinium_carterae.1
MHRRHHEFTELPKWPGDAQARTNQRLLPFRRIPSIKPCEGKRILHCEGTTPDHNCRPTVQVRSGTGPV